MLEAGQGNFTGGLTTRKYVSIAKISRATAFRKISDMLDKKILRPLSVKAAVSITIYCGRQSGTVPTMSSDLHICLFIYK